MKNLILLLLVSISISISVSAQQNAPDLILYNGKIFTSDAEKPNAEAIAIRGERISAVGSNAEIKKLAGANTRLIDLQGRTVIPGINDAHAHFSMDKAGFDLPLKNFDPSWEETKTAIKAAVKETPAGTWIFGSVFSKVMVNEEVTRAALDKIAPNHPVLLSSPTGHLKIFNSKAMPFLQISDEQADPLGGNFERVGNTKKVNGRFSEYAAFRQGRLFTEEASDADAIAELKKMADEVSALGITSTQIMPFMRIDRFARLVDQADLPIRIRAMAFSLTLPGKRDLSEVEMLSKLKFPNSKVTASGIKWILDGTPVERSAAYREPYDEPVGWRGKLNFSADEIEAMLIESLRFKQQILLHCIGDQCVEAVFDAMEKVGGNKKIDWKSKRVRIEHGDGVSGDLIARAKKLGVIIVQNPTHFPPTDDLNNLYGSKHKNIPFRTLIDSGVTVALGSDGPLNPFLGIMLASTVRPNESITRQQALRAYTYESAYAEFAENQKGTLTKGKLADLAILSQDIFSVTPDVLPNTQSILTILGGKIVHDAKVLK